MGVALILIIHATSFSFSLSLNYAYPKPFKSKTLDFLPVKATIAVISSPSLHHQMLTWFKIFELKKIVLTCRRSMSFLDFHHSYHHNHLIIFPTWTFFSVNSNKHQLFLALLENQSKQMKKKKKIRNLK